MPPKKKNASSPTKESHDSGSSTPFANGVLPCKILLHNDSNCEFGRVNMCSRDMKTLGLKLGSLVNVCSAGLDILVKVWLSKTLTQGFVSISKIWKVYFPDENRQGSISRNIRK